MQSQKIEPSFVTASKNLSPKLGGSRTILASDASDKIESIAMQFAGII
jgi:hypothetical protein